MRENVFDMVKIGILGATGYAALELIRILLRHPEAEIVALTSRQPGEPHVSTVHTSFTGRLDLRLQQLTPEQVADRCECVFSCLPHAASAQVVSLLADQGVRVVDFSADYRLHDAEVYRDSYGDTHCDAERLGRVPYGLPELFADQIRNASLVANPGCFPTSVILALAPLLQQGVIEPLDIIVDAKTGVTGAGRSPSLMTHFPECNESVSAYNVGRHRHTPEINQMLRIVTGQSIEVIFTPHLIPMDRGILTTAYAKPTGKVDEQRLAEVLRTANARNPFVRVVEYLPSTKAVCGTNFCDVAVRLVRDRVVTISCLDNLIKGASGTAVQNFNLMCGFPETMGLL